MSDRTPPVPFEIAERDGVRVATNGRTTLTTFVQEGGRTFKRRAAAVSTQKPTSEGMLPRVNELASRLLANPGMTPAEVKKELDALSDSIDPSPALSMGAEWVVAELDGVFVYVFEGGVIVSKRGDIYPKLAN